MTKKIVELTPEQWSALSEFREAVRSSALRPQWASDDEIRKTVSDLYTMSGRSAPAVWVFDDPAQ